MSALRRVTSRTRIEKFVLVPAMLLFLLAIPQCKKSPVEPPTGPNLTPPTNLNIEVLPGTRKIEVTWTLQTPEVVGVAVERRIGFFGPFKQMMLSTTPITAIIDSLTNLDSAYFYRVRHFKDVTFGPYSDTAAINIGLPAPTNLDTATTTEEAVNLTWNDNSSSETGFTVERRDTSASSKYVVLDTLGPNATSFADGGKLDGGGLYYYRVKALGESDFGVVVASIPSNVLLVAVPPFQAPSNITVSIPAETSLVVHWSDNTASESKFYIELKSGSSYVKYDSVGADVTAYNGTKLMKTDTTYTFRLRAESSHRRSPYSAPASGSLPFPPPTNLASTALTEQGISLTWHDNSSFESGFQLERQVGPSGTFLPVSAVIPANATSFMDSVSKKVDTMTYLYRIRAISAKGNQSLVSNTASSKFLFPGPDNLTMASTSLSSLGLQWTLHSVSEQSVMIERNNLTLARLDSITLPAGTTQYTFTAFDTRCSYQFRVKAKRGAQESLPTPPLLAGGSATDFALVRSIADTAAISCVAADSAGLLIASGGANGIVRLWNGSTGAEVAGFVPDTLSPVLAVIFSPANDLLVAGYADGTVRAWYLNTHVLAWKKSAGSAVFAMAASPTGQTFATALADQTIRIWNTAGAVTATLRGHQNAVTTVAYSASGSFLASGSLDASVIVWDLRTLSQSKVIASAHAARINSVAFLQAADSMVVSAADDGLVRVWNSNTGANVKTLLADLNGTKSVASPDGRTIFSAGADASVRFWKGSDWNLVRSQTVHSDVITGATLSGNRTLLVTGGRDKKLAIWSITSAWIKL